MKTLLFLFVLATHLAFAQAAPTFPLSASINAPATGSNWAGWRVYEQVGTALVKAGADFSPTAITKQPLGSFTAGVHTFVAVGFAASGQESAPSNAYTFTIVIVAVPGGFIVTSP